MWVKHPTRDVAAMVVEAPPEFVKAAIPLNYLGAGRHLQQVQPGSGRRDDGAGIPRGLSANPAGCFLILRSGRGGQLPLAPRRPTS
ncbi:hypothetical protein ACRAWD_06030 [Caulobacter segnis]